MQRMLLAFVVFAFYVNLSACSGGSSATSAVNYGNGLSDIKVYFESSPYEQNIAQCARAKSVEESCILDDLPFIGMESGSPDIDMIMSRVVVSHNWMGLRFSQVLEQMPRAILPLFSAVTAIVIDADIRPSYYDNFTGAIYLDPRYLWLSNTEKQTINKKADYRSGFDDPLAFSIFSRYMKSGNYAYGYWSLDGSETRQLEDIKLPLARVLLHELAHANDFLPPGSERNLDSSANVASALINLPVPLLSSELATRDPLTSDLMRSIAGVMYRGNTPSEQDLSTTATQAGSAFGDDVASDDYAYTSQYEDLAMLFENTMMAYFFDATHEIGFATPKFASAYYCDEFTISWGSLNRIGDPLVKERARFVSTEVLVGEDLSAFFFALPAAESTSTNWCIRPSSSIASMSHARQSVKPVRPDDSRRPYH